MISGFEHNAVVRPLHHIGAEMIVAGRRLFDPADTLAAFEAAVTPDTQAVICTHVSNVFGYILPLEEIAALCRARRVPLIVDASQSAGLLPVSLEKLGAAFVCMPGHKALYGPQGTGLLLCGRTPDTLLEGGSGSASRLPDMPPELLSDYDSAGPAVLQAPSAEFRIGPAAVWFSAVSPVRGLGGRGARERRSGYFAESPVFRRDGLLLR